MSRRDPREWRRLSGTSGGAPFSPLSIAGLSAWYRTDSLVTQAGGIVSAWGDKSGNGNNLAQVGAQRPTYNASDASYANKPSFGFSSASSQEMSSTSYSINQPFTVYQVLANTNASGASFDCEFGGTNCRIRRTGTVWAIFAGTNVNSASTVATVCAVAATFNGASSNLWINSSSAPVLSGVNIGTNNLVQLAVGGNGASTASMDGTMGETIIYSGAHTNANVAALFAYIAAFWGLAVS